MTIIKRDLQRRHGLPQSSPPESLMHHHHALWDDKIITLCASGTSYTNTTYLAIGAKVVLNPAVLVYAVKAELVTTAEFTAGGGDSFIIKLSVGSNDYEYTFTSALTYENSITDISIPITDFFKDFVEKEFSISVKVSNAGNPVTLHGAYLKFTIYLEDSYGDYSNSVAPMLIDKSNINKESIKKLDILSRDFEYLSGIVPR